MSRSADVIVLGAGFRGLWLSSQLVKLGWKVTWVQLQKPQTNLREGGFRFDDWPLQVGPQRPESRLIDEAREFIAEVLQPETQDIAIQILTPEGPLELSGEAQNLALKKFFKKSHKDLKKYFECIGSSQALNDAKPDNRKSPGSLGPIKDLIKAASQVSGRGRKLLFAHTKKIFELPLGDRWVLEWLGSLRRSRPVSTRDWILNWEGDILNPTHRLWLLKDSMETLVERGMKWASDHGVKVIRDAVVNDFGIEGRTVTGVEVVGGEGFLKAKHIVVACSYDTAREKVPHFVKHVPAPTEPESEKWCWARCGFHLKTGAKPAGLLPFSSYVIDPHMPLVEENMALIRWVVDEKNDHVTVWSRVPYHELKRRSYLINMTEMVQKNMDKLFPYFSKNILAVIPFEEYFHSPDQGHDDLAIIFDEKNKFIPFRTRLRNLWMIGPGYDRGLELLSRLATEYRVLSQLSEYRKKELKKSDRSIHSARNGQDLVNPK